MIVAQIVAKLCHVVQVTWHCSPTLIELHTLNIKRHKCHHEIFWHAHIELYALHHITFSLKGVCRITITLSRFNWAVWLPDERIQDEHWQCNCFGWKEVLHILDLSPLIHQAKTLSDLTSSPTHQDVHINSPAYSKT